MKRIAFITDIHLNETFPLENGVNPGKNLQVALEDIRQKGIDVIVFGGDIGDASSHPHFFSAFKDFNLFLVLGNHDKYAEVKDSYSKGDGASELYYKWEDEGFKLLFLDSSKDEVSAAQLAWLQQECNSEKKLVLFIHHPIVPVDTYADQLFPLRNRQAFLEILEESEKEIMVFCGHYHINDERSQGKLRQVTTQALSFQLKKDPGQLLVDNTVFGYRIIHLDADGIKTEIINLT